MLERFTTLTELSEEIERLLTENAIIFRNFGPGSAYSAKGVGVGAADVWKKERLRVIVPNNQRISQLLLNNRRLYDGIPEFGELAEEFIAHEKSYSAFVEVRNDMHQFFPFPPLFADRVKVEARKL